MAKKNKKIILRKIDPMSAAKIQTIISGVIGIIIGAIYALIFAFKPIEGATTGMTALVCIAFLILAPVIYAIIGFLGGLIGAVIYNWTASKMGGMKLEIEE